MPGDPRKDAWKEKPSNKRSEDWIQFHEPLLFPKLQISNFCYSHLLLNLNITSSKKASQIPYYIKLPGFRIS